MKKQILAASTVVATLALAAGASTGASADSPSTQASGTATTAALSAHPTAGQTANYRGAIVPAGGVEIRQGQLAYDGGSTILTIPEVGGTVSPMDYSDCAAGYVCLWHDSGYNGRRLQFSSTGCHNLGDYGFNDEASSYRNRLNRYARLRKDANCKGDYLTMDSGAASSSLGGFNDDASSVGIS
jgi:hypothetical protein